MITKKEWDALSLRTKRQILAVIYGDDFEKHFQSRELLLEYRHNFDYNETGERLKKVLMCLYKTNTENIITVKVPVFVTQSSEKFLPSPIVLKKKKPTSTTSASSKQRHWKIDYEDKSGDLCHVHLWAHSKLEAEEEAKREYWDIKEIIQVTEI